MSYNTANTKREVIYRQQVQGLYTRGLPNGEVAWKNVTVADAVGPTAAFPPAQNATSWKDSNIATTWTAP